MATPIVQLPTAGGHSLPHWTLPVPGVPGKAALGLSVQPQASACSQRSNCQEMCAALPGLPEQLAGAPAHGVGTQPWECPGAGTEGSAVG